MDRLNSLYDDTVNGQLGLNWDGGLLEAGNKLSPNYVMNSVLSRSSQYKQT